MANENSCEHDHSPNHSHDPGLAEMLDLDALVLHEHLREIFEWTAKHQQFPRTIVDLGAGSGTGTLGLAHTFPAANIVAIDQSEFMLDHLTTAAQKQRLSHQVSTLQLDLDIEWPELSEVDLVWASSSMHHMSDPVQTLSQIGDMVAPAGLAMIVEMDALPLYLPGDLGFGTPGLEQRLHDAAALAGWNSHPDWVPFIQEAGLETVEQRTFTYETNQNPDLIARTAQALLSRLRDGLEDTLSAEDLATVNDLLDPYLPASLSKRTDLSMRGSRTAWAVRSPR